MGKKGGSASGNNLPNVSYDTGGMYGSGTAGKDNNFFGTNFQQNLVKKSEQGIDQYLDQLVNPSYDSEVFKAQTDQRNRLAEQSYHNNLINPLASNGLTRGSSAIAMGNTFANTLANLEKDAMATEDQRVANVLGNLLQTYNVPYNQMMGLQQQAGGLSGTAASANAQQNAANSQANGAMWGGIANGLGQLAGGWLGGK